MLQRSPRGARLAAKRKRRACVGRWGMPVLAYHVVFSAYGHWLPNDPRGSGSKYVGSKDLRPFGPATYLEDRTWSVAGKPHDRAKRKAAKHALQRPPGLFNGL